MGITDKITGRVKQAAGDLLGHDELKREGTQEERKGEAKDQLNEHELKAEQAAGEAAETRAAAEDRAQAAAERELERGEQAAAGADARAASHGDAAADKAREVQARDQAT